MAEQTISITLNGEKKEVAADQTGVQLFSDDKNIIAVRLNGEPRDLYTELHDGDVVEPIALDSEDGVAIMRHSATHVMAQARRFALTPSLVLDRSSKTASTTISMSRLLSLRRTSRKSKSACSALSSPPSPSAAAW